MNNTLRFGLVVSLVASTFACKTVDQRYYYRQGITAFEKHIPPASKTCWLTPDLVGQGGGSNSIAEEEFTKYLLEKNLCKVVEKHVDDVAGYTWPKDEVCPCAANVSPCSMQCQAKHDAPAGGGMPGLGSLGGGGASPDDNNRSSDKLLERYKKSQLVDKVIVYRIDELTKDRAIIHFRLSDAKASSGTIEASQWYVILPKVEVTEAVQ